jgi:hypothetical protein
MNDITVNSVLIGDSCDMTITHIPTGMTANGYVENRGEHRALRERLMKELQERYDEYMNR